MPETPEPPSKPPPDSDDSGPKNSLFNPRTLLIWLLILLSVFVVIQLTTDTDGSEGEKYTLDQLYSQLSLGLKSPIARIDVSETDVTVHMRDMAVSADEAEHSLVIDTVLLPNLVERVDKINEEIKQLREQGKQVRDPIQFEYDKGSALLNSLMYMLPWILMLLFVLFLFRQMRSGPGGGVLSFGKSRAKLLKRSSGVTFNDVAGIQEAKEDVLEVIEFLRDPERFETLGGRVPRGILLVGPPGTGKTLLAKAIAGEAERPFFNISGSDFVEMFVGVGASRVRDMFRQAKENSPCIIFLDEIDAVGRRRGAGMGGGHDEREQTLNAILVEMDGFESDERVIMIAATNRPDVLDPALLRPGRFDRQITVDMPDVRGREAILKVKAERVKVAQLDDLKTLARGTTGCTGADLENILNESAIIAVLNGHTAVELSDLEEARDKVLWGRARKSRVISEYERRIGAFHEAGHAVIAQLLEHCDPLHKVTIIPRGRAGGMTMSLPEEDTYLMPKKKLLDQISMALGGRVAEEVFCDDVTSGAQSDFEQATEIARMMVCRWGMSEEMGPINYARSEEHLFLGREVTRTQNISEATAVKIDNAVHNIINECNSRCHRLIEDHRDNVKSVAEALLEHEILDAQQVTLLMEGKSLPAPNNSRKTSQSDTPDEQTETDDEAKDAPREPDEDQHNSEDPTDTT